MHGVIAVLVIGVIALVKWLVEIPDRRELNSKIAESNKRYNEIRESMKNNSKLM